MSPALFPSFVQTYAQSHLTPHTALDFPLFTRRDPAAWSSSEFVPDFDCSRAVELLCLSDDEVWLCTYSETRKALDHVFTECNRRSLSKLLVRTYQEAFTIFRIILFEISECK